MRGNVIGEDESESGVASPEREKHRPLSPRSNQKKGRGGDHQDEQREPLGEKGRTEHEFQIVEPASPVERIAQEPRVYLLLGLATQEFPCAHAVGIERSNRKRAQREKRVSGGFREGTSTPISHDRQSHEQREHEESGDAGFHKHRRTRDRERGDESLLRPLLVMADDREDRCDEQHHHHRIRLKARARDDRKGKEEIDGNRDKGSPTRHEPGRDEIQKQAARNPVQR